MYDNQPYYALLAVQKLQDRKETFEQMDVDDKQREKWIEVFKLQYMSSEESEDENTLKVKPISWLSSRVNKFKRSLDKERTKTLNSQSKRQAK